MGFDQRGTVVICVSPGVNGTWDVSEKGFDKPLASFDNQQDAYAYANDLKEGKEGETTVLVEDEEGFSLMPPQGDQARSRNERARSSFH